MKSYTIFSEGIQATMLSALRRDLINDFLFGHMKEKKEANSRLENFYQEISQTMYSFLISKKVTPDDPYDIWINSHSYRLPIENSFIEINPQNIDYRKYISEMELSKIASHILYASYKMEIVEGNFDANNVLDPDSFIKELNNKEKTIKIISSAIKYFGIPNEKQREIETEHGKEFNILKSSFAINDVALIEEFDERKEDLETLITAIEQTIKKGNGDANSRLVSSVCLLLEKYGESEDKQLLPGRDSFYEVASQYFTRSYTDETGEETNPRANFLKLSDENKFEGAIRYALGNTVEEMTTKELKESLNLSSNRELIAEQMIEVRSRNLKKRKAL